MSVTVQIPELSPSNLTLETLEEFERRATIFTIQNPSIPLSVLIEESFALELKAEGIDTSDKNYTLKNFTEWCRQRLLPHSILALVEELQDLRFPMVPSTARNFEAGTRLQAAAFRKRIELYSKTPDPEGFLDPIDDNPNADELLASFDKLAARLFRESLNPTAFRKKAQTLLALHNAARAYDHDQPLSQTPAGGPKAPAQARKAQYRPDAAKRLPADEPKKPSRPCGGPHTDFRCDKHPRYSENNNADSASTNEKGGKGPLTTPATVKGKTYSFVVDTGASRSFISSKALRTLPKDAVQTSLEEKIKVTLGDGRSLVTDQAVTFKAAFPALGITPLEVTWKYYVLPGEFFKVLIGCDLLRSLALIGDGTLNLNLHKLSSIEEDEDWLPFYHEYLTEDANMATTDDSCGVNVPESKIRPEILEIINSFDDIFEEELPKEGSRLEPMSIELIDEWSIVQCRARRLDPVTQGLVSTELEQLRRDGIIQDSTGPYSSPIVVVRQGHKGSTKIRLCIDYKELNSKTVRDNFPLPNAREFVDRASGCKYFAGLDLRQGYYQMRMHEEDIPKTAFVTPDAYCEFTRCPFGLMNAPARFQRAMPPRRARHYEPRTPTTQGPRDMQDSLLSTERRLRIRGTATPRPSLQAKRDHPLHSSRLQDTFSRILQHQILSHMRRDESKRSVAGWITAFLEYRDPHEDDTDEYRAFLEDEAEHNAPATVDRKGYWIERAAPLFSDWTPSTYCPQIRRGIADNANTTGMTGGSAPVTREDMIRAIKSRNSDIATYQATLFAAIAYLTVSRGAEILNLTSADIVFKANGCGFVRTKLYKE
ncbi:Aspartyl protease [Carpediemonas membranifera]|uniref:Aspartyl protease n=1 Tax=Carpediemonas membranifera TaxID=201153 RepID=A0A8J6AWG8_9EUKA|nr:Aspartyl protease [Carpediemonas membranifera]|eukprot:KAG9395908.1 Aspartyl protease [Carpediemonas membranifera]